MNKTPKTYRDDLAKDFGAKRKDANEKIKRIQENPDFLESHKEEAINVVKINLYKELDDTRGTEEYKNAKSKKQALRGKKQEVKKHEEIVAEQKKLLGEKEDELGKMSEEYGEKIEKKESKETGKITHEHLLNKPNMTAKDKEGMQKSIGYLVEKKMDTSENLKKLDAIIYTQESIEIGGVKRARKDITAKPNKKTIFQHNDVTYFKRSEEMIKEQNTLLAKQGMGIPLDSSYEKSLQALPGTYSKGNWYEGGNILSFITDMSVSGSCGSGGILYNDGGYGYRWSASPRDIDSARAFAFGRDGGRLLRNNRDDALPVRPVLK